MASETGTLSAPVRHLDVRPRVAQALRDKVPVVALESTLIAHGLPWPDNLEVARAAESVVREEGAVPATIAVWRGRPTVGLTESELIQLAKGQDIRKASRRDLAGAIAQGATAATTVSATMSLAHRAGIRIFATGGIGGVHPSGLRVAEGEVIKAGAAGPGGGVHPPPATRNPQWDVSADLPELGRTPVAVVCAGAKNILDLPATLEVLETLGVPVLGFGVQEFPAFYLRTSGLPVSDRVEDPGQAADWLAAHWGLGGAGVVLALPVPDEAALDPDAFARALAQAEEQATRANVRGPALTPFLLARLAEITCGQTLRANRALILANARVAARVAHACLSRGFPGPGPSPERAL